MESNKISQSTAYDLLIETTGMFKWYLGLKSIFHKAIDIVSKPPLFFQKDPIPFY